jgi:hypothetical protein
VGYIPVPNRAEHTPTLRVLPPGAEGDGLPLVARLGLRRMGVLVADIA